MESYTSLLELRVTPEDTLSLVTNPSLIQDISRALSSYGFSEEHIHTQDLAPGRALFVLYVKQDDGSSINLRMHPSGLVTLDLNEYIKEGENPKFIEREIDCIKKTIAGIIKGEQKPGINHLKRGCPFNSYFPTTDNQLIEYDFDKLVFEQQSEFQNVKIYHSNQFGNMLILDDDPNLAESDILYTQSITGHDHEDYKDRTVLILGGGDGGILHELLKQDPKFVTMVDIDGVVVEAARKHLRGICYDALDQLKGDNYEVLIADCVPILKQYVKEGHVFDYVINDLTAIPCTTEPVGDHWDFLRLILDLSMKVLAPHGKYYTQGNGYNMKNALTMYESQLENLESPVDFKTKATFVPSYHELWVFYEIWKKQDVKE